MALVALVLPGLTGTTALAAVPPSFDPFPDPGVVPGSLLVRPEGDADLTPLVARFGGRVGAHLPGGYRVVTVDPVRSGELEGALRSSGLVRDVEADHLRAAFQRPDDPNYAGDQAAYLEAIRLPEAWDVTTGSDELVIGIVDSGVDLDHPDLTGRLLPGRDFIDGDARPDDANGHGTLMAGIAAANSANGVGVSGVAWRARILPVRVLDQRGLGADSQVAQGIAWAAEQGADVINLSFGGPASSRVLEAAVEDATARGVVVVGAAGNSGSGEAIYPAALPGVVAVSAIGLDRSFASFSNWGWWVDVAAPGEDVAGPWPGGGYARGSGTSHASAVVAGVALLARAADPQARPAQIAATLRHGARDAGVFGVDPFYGAGIVDGLAAVGGARPAPASSGPVPGGDRDGSFDGALPLEGSVRGSIAPEGDVDWYSVEVASAEQLRFRVRPPAGRPTRGFDPVLRLFGPDALLVQRVDDTGEGAEESLGAVIGQPGSYRLEVRNANGSTSPGDYLLDVERDSSSAAPAAPGPALWLTEHVPADLAADVPANVGPRMRFARRLDPSALSSQVELLDAASGARVDASLTYDGGWVTLRPGHIPPSGRAFLVRVGRELRDEGGEALGEDLSFRYVVGDSLDERPPETSLASTPPAQGASGPVSFALESDEEAASFECSLDGAAFTPCSSPVSYPELEAGTHRFEARALDAAGNRDQSPASWSFSTQPSGPGLGRLVPVIGYSMLSSEGAVHVFGGRHLGDPTVRPTPSTTVVQAADLEMSPSGRGYWVVDERGRVYAYGDAAYLGALDPTLLGPGERVVDLSADAAGDGYWLFTSAGRVVAFGAVRPLGDLLGVPVSAPVIDAVANPRGDGYWMLAADGGVFAFGAAGFAGSMADRPLAAPLRGLVPDPDGSGYWLVGADGGVFAFDAPFLGSMAGQALNRPIAAMTTYGHGYLMAAADGGVFNFSERPFVGSLGSAPPRFPVVAIAAGDSP